LCSGITFPFKIVMVMSRTIIPHPFVEGAVT
jgi:hypothetical protein